MLGADDESEADAGSNEVSEVDALAAAAEGDSVTADRLAGRSRHFPDCRPALHPGQQPHHLLWLTTLDPTFYTSNGGVSHGRSASDGGVVLLTEEELLLVVDEVVCEVPYSRIQGTIRLEASVTVHGTGGVAYRFYVANSADEAEIAAAYDYLRRTVREHS